jgi:hypothetical protein
MKKLLLPLFAATVLVLPASAFAWDGGHSHHQRGFARLTVHTNIHAGAIAGLDKLSGTGTTFGNTSASVSGTTFTASLSTTWSSAQTKSFNGGSVSCAPATASITLSGTTTSYTGKTCSWTRIGTTKYAFFGKASDGAHAFLMEDGTAVTGAVFSGNRGLHLGVFAAAHMGTCDHH